MFSRIKLISVKTLFGHYGLKNKTNKKQTIRSYYEKLSLIHHVVCCPCLRGTCICCKCHLECRADGYRCN